MIRLARPQGVDRRLQHLADARNREHLVEQLVERQHHRTDQPGENPSLLRRQLPNDTVDLVDLGRHLLQFGQRRLRGGGVGDASKRVTRTAILREDDAQLGDVAPNNARNATR